MPNYQYGKIYKLESYQTDKIYIGSTSEPYLSNRLSAHRRGYRKYLNGKYHYVTSFELVRYEDVKITLIENFPCNSKYELEAREGYHIQNNECVNKNVSGRSKEYIKQYHREYNKQYRDNNKDKVKQRNKQYKLDNKDKIKQYNEQYRKASKNKKLFQEAGICNIDVNLFIYE